MKERDFVLTGKKGNLKFAFLSIVKIIKETNCSTHHKSKQASCKGKFENL